MTDTSTATRPKAEEVVAVTEDYYDSDDADRFYFNVWGGEDIHVGIYDTTTDIKEASAISVRKLAEATEPVTAETRILDLGAGYGGTARYFAKTYGCKVVCLNISETQNNLNRKLNKEQGLDDKITVKHGNFEDVPEADASFDIVISQDSILHSAVKEKVLREAFRLLKPGGKLVFTDPMQADDADPSQLGAVYARINLDGMGSFKYYKDTAKKVGFKEEKIVDLTPNLRAHYARVREVLQTDYDRMINVSSKEYVDRMLSGLAAWVKAADEGNLAWGILSFKKP